MVGPSCWAYARAVGDANGRSWRITWRCPIQAVRKHPANANESQVDLVDDRLCDFNVDLGAPMIQSVDMEIMRL